MAYGYPPTNCGWTIAATSLQAALRCILLVQKILQMQTKIGSRHLFLVHKETADANQNCGGMPLGDNRKVGLL